MDAFANTWGITTVHIMTRKRTGLPYEMFDRNDFTGREPFSVVRQIKNAIFRIRQDDVKSGGLLENDDFDPEEVSRVLDWSMDWKKKMAAYPEWKMKEGHPADTTLWYRFFMLPGWIVYATIQPATWARFLKPNGEPEESIEIDVSRARQETKTPVYWTSVWKRFYRPEQLHTGIEQVEQVIADGMVVLDSKKPQQEAEIDPEEVEAVANSVLVPIDLGLRIVRQWESSTHWCIRDLDRHTIGGFKWSYLVGAFLITYLNPHHFHTGRAFIDSPNEFKTMSDLVRYAAYYRKRSLVKEGFDPEEIEAVAQSCIGPFGIRQVGSFFHITFQSQDTGEWHPLDQAEFVVKALNEYWKDNQSYTFNEGRLGNEEPFDWYIRTKYREPAAALKAKTRATWQRIRNYRRPVREDEFDPEEVEALANPMGDLTRVLQSNGFTLERHARTAYAQDPAISMWNKDWRDATDLLAATTRCQVGMFWSDQGNARIKSAYLETCWCSISVRVFRQIFYTATDLNAFLKDIAELTSTSDHWQMSVADTEAFHTSHGRFVEDLQNESSDATLRERNRDSAPETSQDTASVATAQQFTSAKTCLKQVPALHKWVIEKGLVKKGMQVLDLGGGKYDLATAALAEHGVINMVWDPYNRPPEHNFVVLEKLSGGKADAVLCANTLNVIKERAQRLQVVARAAKALKEGGTAYFSVYSSPGGKRRTGKDAWQEGRPIQSYLPEIKKCFESVQVTKGYAVAKKPIPEGVTNHLKEDFDPEEVEATAVQGLDTDRGRLTQLLHNLLGEYPVVTKPKITYADTNNAERALHVWIELFYDDQRTSPWGIGNWLSLATVRFGITLLSSMDISDQLEGEPGKPAWARIAFIMQKDTRAPQKHPAVLQEEP
jgi:hypothetical protein